MKLPKKIVNEINEFVKKMRMNEREKTRFIKNVEDVYKKMLYEYAEPIGIVTAQSLSEPATQMTMRTYHFAGTAGIQVTIGLPRLIEIFDAKKVPETPSMTIYVEKEYQDEDKVMEIARKLREMKFKDFIKGYITDLMNMVVKFKMDIQKIENHNLSIEKIAKKIKIKDVDVKVNNNEIIIKIVGEDVKNIYKIRHRVMDLYIKGIKNVSQVIVKKDENGEFVINTLGSNLKKALEIKGVDKTRTYTNNIFEIYEIFGIEAARNAIIREAKKTIEEQGLGVDTRYVTLLADLMTVNGKIMGIGRYGIVGNKKSILARMAFEEVKKHLIDGSVRNEKDEIKGPIEHVIVSQLAPIGSGIFKLSARIGGKNDKEN